MRILTVGHGNLTIERFQQLLLRHDARTLVDVRSAPYSGRFPQYSRSSLDALLAIAGIRYVFLGDKLGGRPRDQLLYDRDGNPDYDKIAGTKEYRAGIEALLQLAESDEVAAIMCSESDYRECHRFGLVSRTLALAGTEVKHILKDGSLDDNPAPQLALPGSA
jgi:uncharacterized protein (DUF488 family)